MSVLLNYFNWLNDTALVTDVMFRFFVLESSAVTSELTERSNQVLIRFILLFYE
jgi:hypothetical protein